MKKVNKNRLRSHTENSLLNSASRIPTPKFAMAHSKKLLLGALVCSLASYSHAYQLGPFTITDKFDLPILVPGPYKVTLNGNWSVSGYNGVDFEADVSGSASFNQPTNVAAIITLGGPDISSSYANRRYTMYLKNLTVTQSYWRPDTNFGVIVAPMLWNLQYHRPATDMPPQRLVIDANTTDLSQVNRIYGAYNLEGSANQSEVTLVAAPTGSNKLWETRQIIGGFSGESSANSNKVNINGNVKIDYVAGGESEAMGTGKSVDSNTVSIRGSGSINSVYGGRYQQSRFWAVGNASRNLVFIAFDGTFNTVAGGQFNDGRFDGESLSNVVTIQSPSSIIVQQYLVGGFNGIANSNTVTIEQGAKASIKLLAGGATANTSGEVNSNNVLIYGGTKIDEINGGISTVGGATAQKNVVTIDAPNLKVGKVAGGSSDTALLNRVIIKQASADEVYGGKTTAAAGTANQNFVYLENAEGATVFGGWAGKEAVKNTVLLHNSKSGTAVYGGYVSAQGTAATDNIVQVTGTSTINGDIYGAYSANAAISPQLARNSVSLNGDITVTGGVYAAAAVGNGPIGDKNALVFGGKVKAGTIGGFNDLHLLVGDDNLISGSGDYILTITGSNTLDLNGKNIDVYDFRNTPSTHSEEKYGLVKLSSSAGNNSGIQMSGNVTLHSTFLDKNWALKSDNVEELYLMDGKLVVQPPTPNNPVTPSNPPTPPSNPPTPPSNPPTTPSDPIVITPTTTANVNSESLSQNRASSIGLANQSALFAVDAGLSAMKDQIYGKNFFFVGEGGMNKYGHGFNKIELNGGSVITGMMNNFDGTLLGGFFEASWGHSSSKESVFSAKSNIQSYGVGVLASREIYPNWEVDGSLRFGWMRNSFKGRYFDVNGSADFKTNMPYASAHFGTAYNFPVSDTTTISPYARYIVSYLGSDKVNAGSAEDDRYKAKSTVSHTVRAGVKVKTQLSENFKFVGGVAIDETMGAKAKGRISGYDLKTLSVNGTTAVGELKLQAVPSSTSPWKVEIGVNGYAGKKRGVSGEASVNYRF